MRDSSWTINPAGRGKARILITGIDPGTGAAVGLGKDLSQGEVRRMVEDLCRCTGLPKPWGEG